MRAKKGSGTSESLAAAVLAAALVAGGPARSQPAEDRIEAICAGERVDFPLPHIARFDADGDGSIAASEAATCEALDSLFDRLDLDADGSLTGVEYAAFADLWQRRIRAFGDDATTP